MVSRFANHDSVSVLAQSRHVEAVGRYPILEAVGRYPSWRVDTMSLQVFLLMSQDALDTPHRPRNEAGHQQAPQRASNDDLMA